MARDPREQIKTLGREAHGDDFEKFLDTHRRSLQWDMPAKLMQRGEYRRVIALLS